MLKSLLIDFKGSYHNGDNYTFWYNVERSATVSTDIHVLNYGNISKASCWYDVPNRRLYVNGVEGYFSMAGHTMTFVSVPDRTNDILDFLSTTDFIAQKSGNPIQFNSTAGNINELLVTLTPSQSGSGDPSPDNVRPISGVTSVTVTRTGKNLLPYPYVTQAGTISGVAYAVSTDGTISFSGTLEAGHNFTCANNIFLKGGVTYTLSWNGTASNNIISLNVHSPAIGTLGILRPANVSGIVFTPSADTTASVFLDSSSGNAGKAVSGTLRPQLEIGSAITAYEPYQGQSVTVSTGEAETVYGGTLDVLTGELTVTHEKIMLNGSENWTKGIGFAYTGIANSILPISSDYVVAGLTCSHYPVTTLNNLWRNTWTINGIAQHVPNSGNAICISDTECADFTVEQWKSRLANSPIELVYPLATPSTYQVSPAQLSTLDGNNIVYTNGDKVTINAIMKFEV